MPTNVNIQRHLLPQSLRLATSATLTTSNQHTAYRSNDTFAIDVLQPWRAMLTGEQSVLWNPRPTAGSRVVAVSLSPQHRFSKQPHPSIRLLAGVGVEGDAHCGATVQHLYLKRKNPAAPNRMQVHLLQAELLDELATEGFTIGPGDLGENILTRGIDLLALPRGTQLRFSHGQHPAPEDAVLELTCLRQPCIQIERFRHGLQKQMNCAPGSPTKYRAGVMAVVLAGGAVSGGDCISATLPNTPHTALTT